MGRACNGLIVNEVHRGGSGLEISDSQRNEKKTKKEAKQNR